MTMPRVYRPRCKKQPKQQPRVDDDRLGGVNDRTAPREEKLRHAREIGTTVGSSHSVGYSRDDTDDNLVGSEESSMQGSMQGSVRNGASSVPDERPSVSMNRIKSVVEAFDSARRSLPTAKVQQSKGERDKSSGVREHDSPSTGGERAMGLSCTRKPRGEHNWEKAGHAEMVDDPTSRTTDETLHLVKVRDGMISAKNNEVLLLSKQNQVLREGMDAIEAEMVSLHRTIETKDDAVQKLTRETGRLHREIKRLQSQSEERRGQESAMDVAVAQNKQLLKLLEQEESKREDVLRERDEALAEVSELKYRVGASDKQQAERNAALEVKLIKGVKESATLTEKYTRVQERAESLEAELEEVKKQAAFEREIRTTELNSRRRGHYELLSQLQDAKDELQQTKDRLETTDQDLEVCRQQSAELDRSLVSTQSDLHTVERTSREQEIRAVEDARLSETSMSKQVSLMESLEHKVVNMSRTILRLVQRHKDLQAEVARRDSEEARLHEQIQKADKRQLTLQQKVIRLESHLDLEATQKHLHSAIDAFNSHMKPGAPVASSETVTEASSRRVSPQEHRGVGDLLWSRRQIFSRFLAFFKLVSDRDASASTVQREVVDETGGEAVDKAVAARKLDLSECGLDDSDILDLMCVVRSCPLLASLDISMNHVGDQAAASIADAFQHPACRLTMIDLRRNQMTMEGVREFAKSLEKSSRHRGVTHVYVHREGRIDALAKRNSSSGDPEDSGRATGLGSLASFASVVVVDVRDNNPPSEALTQSTLDRPERGGNRRRRRQVREVQELGFRILDTKKKR